MATVQLDTNHGTITLDIDEAGALKPLPTSCNTSRMVITTAPSFIA